MIAIIEFEGKTLYFANPQFTLSTSNPSEVEAVLKEVEKVSQRFYLAGFLSYEAGYAFEKVFSSFRQRSSFPLVYFTAYEKVIPFRSIKIPEKIEILNLQNNIDYYHYASKVKKIKDFIASGQTYQINFTFKHKFSLRGNPWDFYLRLKQKQSVPYSAFIEADDFSILSFSPELFFKVEGDQILAKPMKGTIERGKNSEEDHLQKKFLENDPKNRAENLMIVDLFRNDLGRFCQVGSVKTPKLFEVTKYQTLFQMTSTVKGTLLPNIGIYEILRNLFPSGSVTGAPKIRSMQIIAQLEEEPRQIYTGAIGYLTPKGEMKFNVAIRTILIQGSSGEMGIGGGIVWNSRPQKEYQECLLKSSFFTAARKFFV